MKKSPSLFEKWQMLFFGMIANLLTYKLYAQDDAVANTSVTTTKTTTTTEWYTNPIYWVVGAVVLIILVAILAKGKKN